MDLKIGSINVRGLGDQVKRREIFNWLRAKKYSVYFIQEMHCTETIRMIGGPNGAIKLCSAAALVKRRVLPYFLIITSPFKSLKHIPIPRDGL